MFQLEHSAFGPRILPMSLSKLFLNSIYDFSLTLQANVITENITRTVLSSIIQYNKLIAVTLQIGDINKNNNLIVAFYYYNTIIKQVQLNYEVSTIVIHSRIRDKVKYST